VLPAVVPPLLLLVPPPLLDVVPPPLLDAVPPLLLDAVPPLLLLVPPPLLDVVPPLLLGPPELLGPLELPEEPELPLGFGFPVPPELPQAANAVKNTGRTRARTTRKTEYAVFMVFFSGTLTRLRSKSPSDRLSVTAI
jgi:hypothetical protein